LLTTEGSFIKTLTLNNALSDLTFEFHPSLVEKRHFKLNSIDWCNIHQILLVQISNRMEEMKDLYSNKPSQYRIREDLTLTVTTLKKYIYFIQSLDVSNGKEVIKAADLITSNKLLD
jgi:hypothetical protein